MRTTRWLRFEAAAPTGRRRLDAVRPGTVAVLASLVLVAAAGVHLVRYPDTDDAGAGPVAEVGPGLGDDLDDYITQRHAAITSLPDEPIRAVVSFRALTAVAGLPLPAEVDVERLQVLLPGDPTPRELAAEDAVEVMERSFAARRDGFDDEIAELESMLAGGVGDPAFEREFTDQIARLRAARDGTGDRVEVVFAAVVVAPAATLSELVRAPDVLLVDPAGPADQTRDVRLLGVPPTDEDGSRRSVP